MIRNNVQTLLLVNAVEFDFHILASSVINVNARANFCVRVILKLEPRGICIFQTIFCMSDIVDYFVEKCNLLLICP